MQEVDNSDDRSWVDGKTNTPPFICVLGEEDRK
jgi:hypothetical protein